MDIYHFILLFLVLVVIAAGLAPIFTSNNYNILKVGSAESKFEERVRKEIELLTGKKFGTSRPKWLQYKAKNDSGVASSRGGMELDGFNPSLGIAFEAQGPMHSQWNKKEEDYKRYFRRIMMDKAKIGRCNEVGILLIVVDYRLPRHLISAYISSRIHDYVKDKNRKNKLSLDIINKFIEKPAAYVPPDEISATKYPIYRNYELEKELNLKEY